MGSGLSGPFGRLILGGDFTPPAGEGPHPDHSLLSHTHLSTSPPTPLGGHSPKHGQGLPLESGRNEEQKGPTAKVPGPLHVLFLVPRTFPHTLSLLLIQPNPCGLSRNPFPLQTGSVTALCFWRAAGIPSSGLSTSVIHTL